MLKKILRTARDKTNSFMISVWAGLLSFVISGKIFALETEPEYGIEPIIQPNQSEYGIPYAGSPTQEMHSVTTGLIKVVSYIGVVVILIIGIAIYIKRRRAKNVQKDSEDGQA